MFNDVFVLVDARTGTLSRYVAGPLMLTHAATMDGPCMFEVGAVENFRTNPGEGFRVVQPPYEPPPPAGGTPAAARQALPLEAA